jgi:30S ribosomal protein S31
MGRGDKKSRKGKLAMGSYGNSRPHDFKKPAYVAPVKEEKPEEVSVAEEKPKPAAKAEKK